MRKTTLAKWTIWTLLLCLSGCTKTGPIAWFVITPLDTSGSDGEAFENDVSDDESDSPLTPITPAPQVDPSEVTERNEGATAPNFEAHDSARAGHDGEYQVIYFSGIETLALHIPSQTWTTEVGTCGDDGCFLGGENRPEWITEQLHLGQDGEPIEVGAFPGMHGARTLYYSVTDWDLNDGSACIGRAQATGTFHDLEWVDDGLPVLCSTAHSTEERDDAYAIDPAIFEGFDDSLWMAYGSHNSGIMVIELDPETGHVLGELEADGVAVELATPIAFNPLDEEGEKPEFSGSQGGIEAAFVHPHDGIYYLFVNWRASYNGVDPTSSIRVGRSTSPTGPYVDEDGVPMMESGGTLMMESDGPLIGPGHTGISRVQDRLVFTFHDYNGDNDGTETLGFRELDFTQEGWPQVSSSPFLL